MRQREGTNVVVFVVVVLTATLALAVVASSSTLPLVAAASLPSSLSSSLSSSSSSSLSLSDEYEYDSLVCPISTVGGVAPTASSSSSSSSSPLSSNEAQNGESNNPIVNLGRYVWDQIIRTKDGTVALYTNHQACNSIRAKQRAYAMEHFNTKRIDPTTGGITYDEFLFLQRGKDDRGKVANLAFMMFFAPNFMPYAIMFNPGMLPSTFAPTSGGGNVASSLSKKMGHGEAPWQTTSRERSYAVLRAVLDLERSARVPTGWLSSINPFGKAKLRAEMDRIGDMVRTGVFLLSSSSSSSSSSSDSIATNFKSHAGKLKDMLKEKPMLAEMTSTTTYTSSSSSTTTNSPPAVAAAVAACDKVDEALNVLRTLVYTKRTPTKSETQLVNVPKSILLGIACAMEAGKNGSSPKPFYPNFIIRGQVLTKLQRLADADSFLVDQGIDLDTLNGQTLAEACNDRMLSPGGGSGDDYGCPFYSEEELRYKLRRWLNSAVVEPRRVIEAAEKEEAEAAAAVETAAAVTSATLGEESKVAKKSMEEKMHHNSNLARTIMLCCHALDCTKDERSECYLPKALFVGSSNKDGKGFDAMFQ